MKFESFTLTRGKDMPNNPRLPVVIYHGAGEGDLASFFENTFKKNDWGGTWRNGIFDYDHFHSNAHEALGIAAGHATVQLGGDTGRAIKITTGDLLILPAGTGHRRISASEDFLVIGAYPKGQEDYDIRRTYNDELLQKIEAAPLPENDPLLGANGELLTLWKNS